MSSAENLAAPSSPVQDGVGGEQYLGLTKREFFAAAALKGLLSNLDSPVHVTDAKMWALSKKAVRLAEQLARALAGETDLEDSSASTGDSTATQELTEPATESTGSTGGFGIAEVSSASEATQEDSEITDTALDPEGDLLEQIQDATNSQVTVSEHTAVVDSETVVVIHLIGEVLEQVETAAQMYRSRYTDALLATEPTIIQASLGNFWEIRGTRIPTS